MHYLLLFAGMSSYSMVSSARFVTINRIGWRRKVFLLAFAVNSILFFPLFIHSILNDAFVDERNNFIKRQNKDRVSMALRQPNETTPKKKLKSICIECVNLKTIERKFLETLSFQRHENSFAFARSIEHIICNYSKSIFIDSICRSHGFISLEICSTQFFFIHSFIVITQSVQLLHVKWKIPGICLGERCMRSFLQISHTSRRILLL